MAKLKHFTSLRLVRVLSEVSFKNASVDKKLIIYRGCEKFLLDFKEGAFIFSEKVVDLF
jgi:hypothetical protein